MTEEDEKQPFSVTVRFGRDMPTEERNALVEAVADLAYAERWRQYDLMVEGRVGE